MIGCEHYKYTEKPPLAEMAFLYDGPLEFYKNIFALRMKVFVTLIKRSRNGEKKSAPVGADLLDTNKDIDSKKYLFP